MDGATPFSESMLRGNILRGIYRLMTTLAVLSVVNPAAVHEHVRSASETISK